MEIVNNTTYYKNTVNSTSYTEEASRIKKDDEVENKEKINKSDSIELSTTDENVINTRKAYDAMVEVSREYSENDSNQCYTGEFVTLCSMMRAEGMTVPDFSENNKEGFVDFIDQIKAFAQDLMMKELPTVKGRPLTSGFLDFCDSYKEKLIEYGCK